MLQILAIISYAIIATSLFVAGRAMNLVEKFNLLLASLAPIVVLVFSAHYDWQSLSHDAVMIYSGIGIAILGGSTVFSGRPHRL